ncbi:MAG: cryptochrome/photolyase family protein [Cyclobacteriaceae bacterium]|nr:cryptochrome/photolyase family protein [Cyclobacteriaceae bacterium]
MSAATLIFPHQLFEKHPALSKGHIVFLVEEYLFFTQYNFHKQKLVFHRASMKAYQHHLEMNGFEVIYIEAKEEISDIRLLLPYLKNKGITEVFYCHTTDYLLERRISRQALKSNLKTTRCESPLFMLSTRQAANFFVGKKRYLQTDFYIQQRRRFKILLDDKLQPIGGKWTYDTENRLKYPKDKRPPKVRFPEAGQYWKEASDYVNRHFAHNYGEINDLHIYPTTFQESRVWLQQFFEDRFAEFGAYEDALVHNEGILHHSLLTPMLNVGLLSPNEIIEGAILYADRNNIPINSCEGFIRQILGWREFIRGVYETIGSQERTTNHWRFTRKIPGSFWDGTTGIPPLDITIKKVLATGYCHHIERLMVLGNFMLLCEFDPDEVYKWFMELFIDAYDWVMVPNVYGMSQFADGGLMATKPYISGSNYLMKMSDYEKGDWQPIWDGLFWRFMHTHRNFFLTNPRLSMMVKIFDKMAKNKQENHIHTADDFLQALDKY